MSTNLIAHLKKKCEEDGNVAILFAQWEFDQKLVGKALENIGGFYPHFSNHNASHSQQILVNIERILGDDIDLLSATDTWLILEAAYWHDVGMLVDAKNAKEVHMNSDFNFMIQTIANEKGHDLQKFCQAYVEQNWLSAVGTESHPFDGIEKYRQLVAEWFRRGHDKRIGKIVEDPFKDLGITSPRTELLPNRIYRYLGQICVSHGMNFDTLIETLPYKQTGLGTEDCHPRFIGCLLRLGDLFDLDDNRFCPVMAKHVSNMPSVSKHHHDKHLSLREFQLDKRTVKLVAECSDEMSYVETQNWFGWIREEFQNQMSQWNLIVPSLKFGSLPTIEQLDVKMQGNKVLLSNKPMKFSIDENNAIEILEGSGFYKNDTNIYRELIQNAIDATLMRVWIQHSKSKENKLLKNSHPFDKKTQEILNKYPITIDFKKIEDIDGEDESIWEFELKDNGCGISLNDLNYMQKIAGSSKNINRQKIIESMPRWLRPSGQFGIGMHSAFLLMKNLSEDEQKIVLTTKSIYTNKAYEVEMYSPLSKSKGYCFIKELSDSSDISYGTTIKLKLKVIRRGRKYYSNHSKLYKYLEKNYDPLLEETFDKLHIATQLDDIYNDVAKFSPISIKFGDFWQKNLDIIYSNEFTDKKSHKWIWLEHEQLYFYVSTNGDSLSDFSGGWNAWFKGQHVDRLNTGIYDVFNFSIIFYGLDAKSSLNVDRKSWKNDFIRKIQKNNFFENLNYSVLELHYEELKEMLEDDLKLSLFSYLYDPENKLKKIDQNFWKNMKLFSKRLTYGNYNENCGLYENSFNELLELDSFSIVDIRSSNKIEEKFSVNDILIDTNQFRSWAMNDFNECWYKNNGIIEEKRMGRFNQQVYSKNTLELDSNYKIINDMNTFLESPDKRQFYNDEWLELPFFQKFKPLFCRSELAIRLAGIQNTKKLLILPLLFEWENASDEDILNFKKSINHLNVSLNYFDEIVIDSWNARDIMYDDMTQEDYHNLFKELLDELDILLEANNVWKIARKI